MILMAAIISTSHYRRGGRSRIVPLSFYEARGALPPLPACCYARSDKTWVNDPQGVAWETFHSHGEITVYGEDRREGSDSACCGTSRGDAAAGLLRRGLSRA